MDVLWPHPAEGEARLSAVTAHTGTRGHPLTRDIVPNPTGKEHVPLFHLPSSRVPHSALCPVVPQDVLMPISFHNQLPKVKLSPVEVSFGL